MTPCNKIKREILRRAARDDKDLDFGLPLETDEQVAAAYSELVLAGAHSDYEYELRSGDCETGLPAEYSRHYESDSVAMQLSDGGWVGWTYWHGGGKHGCPEEIAWMEAAYDLTCTEEAKTVVVRTFARVP